MFALGVPGVPARGIRTLPDQLAGEVRRSGAEVRLGEPVVTVRGPASGGVGGGSVELAGGEVLSGRAVVVAVGPQAVGDLLDLPVPRTKGLQTWWFAADEAPTPSTMLAVDGRRRGPAVNTAVVSNAAPSYAPPGQHLVQVTCLLPGGGGLARSGSGPDAAGEAGVRCHAGEIYGVDAGPWRLVRRDDVPHALPEQPAPLRTRSPARLSAGVYVCGDHRDTASIQGALVSGNRVADAVLADLASS